MGNLIIDATLISEENRHQINTNGTLNNSIIKYNEEDIEVTIAIKDNTISLLRKHPEYSVTLNFSEIQEITGEYLLNTVNGRFETKTKTKKLIINDNEIEIIYDLFLDGNNQGEYQYILKYGVK